ncbi:MAG: PaaI family thioesterase [Alphaproteobacteria bacterium]|nr:PaaI family thioesterase [Alphaproteobacteria bacterium]MBU1513069.1 PaaI family thioesterase [Alphaproteobacteria bacterium]MBU2095177.1 PaaI family thioesterase [Alphaproteobacteria bacterium]MBU2150664.1 PaaI family thioesterase [Alphaproteobacteria bacterium]MBU2306077.1 PaaI family thioesterase [Alphaproteobacteria bacterium]
MAKLEPKLDADGVNALLRTAFPGMNQAATILVTEVGPGRLHMVAPYRDGLLRPGGVISGPTLMSLADSAAYALVLAHIGDQLMAVTSQLNMSFLRGCQPGDIHAEAQMLRLGRRLAVCDIRLWTEGPDRLAAQANVTYAIP